MCCVYGGVYGCFYGCVYGGGYGDVYGMVVFLVVRARDVSVVVGGPEAMQRGGEEGGRGRSSNEWEVAEKL